eukprot:COSAG01_NODE_11953_length_1828_cov_2.528051_1_plen_519_part_10
MLYSSFYTPYQAAFLGSEAKRERVDIVVDLCFWADMVLAFWTGYDKGFEVVYDKSAIVENYLYGWFLVDFVATMDWEILWDWFVKESEEDKPPQWIPLLRVIKVFRLARAGRIINRLTMTLSIHTKFIDAGIFLLYTFVVTHVVGCLFFIMPDVMVCDINNFAAEMAFADPDVSTSGWYIRGHRGIGNCMQGSWRQRSSTDDSGDRRVGLEQLCEMDIDDYGLRVCQETAEYGYIPGTNHSWSDRFGSKSGGLFDECNHLPTVLDVQRSTAFFHECKVLWSPGSYGPLYTGTFTARECTKCMTPIERYYDSLYWSVGVTTGLGSDHGPATQLEVKFVMAVQIIALAFFAILLTQINTINEVISEDSDKLNAQKNGVVQFLKQHSLSLSLVNESVKYLNFRATSLTGSQFDDDDERFRILSPGIRQKIRVELCKPVLKKVRVFGWDATDIKEEEYLRKVFDDIDTSETAHLSQDEVKQLFTELNLSLNDSQFTRLFNEMDINSTGEIDYAEFRNWWYIKK